MGPGTLVVPGPRYVRGGLPRGHRTSARTRRTSPAAGCGASAAEAPHASATRPARDAATAEPATLAELFQVNAWVRAAGWTAFSVRTFSKTGVAGTAPSVPTAAAPSQIADGASGSSSAAPVR